MEPKNLAISQFLARFTYEGARKRLVSRLRVYHPQTQRDGEQMADWSP